MRPIAYLHIGLEKTGTTTLQDFFFQNKEALLKHNIYFPSSPGQKNHTDLPAYAYDKNLNDLAIRKGIVDLKKREKFREKFKEKFTEELRPISQKGCNILISSEHLSSRVGDADEIRKLIHLFESLNFQPKVILYLRRQDQYLLSTYSTWVKCGAIQSLNQKAYKRPRYNYKAILNLWKEAIGKENMIVGVFDRSRMLNKDLIDDFCSKINLHDISDFERPSGALNQSLDAFQLRFLKEFNKYVPEAVDNKKNELKGDVITLLERISSKDRMQLPDGLAHIIEDYFRADNEDIKNEYLPNLEGPLFSQVEEKNLGDQNLDLDSEALIKLSSQLWIFQQKKINRLQQAWADQDRLIKQLESNQ